MKVTITRTDNTPRKCSFGILHYGDTFCLRGSGTPWVKIGNVTEDDDVINGHAVNLTDGLVGLLKNNDIVIPLECELSINADDIPPTPEELAKQFKEKENE